MKKAIYFLIGILSISCSQTYTVLNHTDSEITKLIVLDSYEVHDFALNYDEIDKRNRLTQSVLPEEKASFKMKKNESPYCLYYEDSEYHGYFFYKPNTDVIELTEAQRLDKKIIDFLVYEPTSLQLKIDNRSEYYIQYVIIESDDFPETYHAMNSWNIIDSRSKKTIVFNGFEKDNEISSILLVGFKDGKKLTIEYKNSFDDFLIFTSE